MKLQMIIVSLFALLFTLVRGFTITTTPIATVTHHQQQQLHWKGGNRSISSYISSSSSSLSTRTNIGVTQAQQQQLYMVKLSDQRKKELGVADNEDEYDLSIALNNNTDPLITKIIAGSLIIVLLGLLIVAVIIPLTTDMSDTGLCNPILNAGRC